MKKLLSLLLVFVLSLSFVTGCNSPDATTENVSTGGGEDNGKVQLKVMIMSEDSNRQAIYQDYYLKRIGEVFPEYEVEFELPGSEDSYNSKLTIYNASETLPDIFWGRDVVYQSGNALPLGDYIEQYNILDNYSNPSALIPAPDGEIYCLNGGTDSFFAGPLFYNKAIFEKEGLEPPSNYEEFLALVKTLKEKNYTPISATAWAIQNFLFADLIGAEDFTNMQKLESKELAFNDPSIIAGVEKLLDLTNAGAFPSDVTSIEQQVHEQLFIDGKAAMIYHPVWVLPSIAVSDFEIGHIYLPEVFGQKTVNAWGSATGGGFMVSKNTANPEAAVKVAQWLALQDAEYFYEVGGNVTAIKGFDALPENSPAVIEDIYNKMRDPEITVVPNFPTNYMTQGQQSEFGVQIEKILTNQMTAEEFGEAMSRIY
jgi:raffinose/stachyose/melibiose transport system substrate-binding protein